MTVSLMVRSVPAQRARVIAGYTMRFLMCRSPMLVGVNSEGRDSVGIIGSDDFRGTRLDSLLDWPATGPRKVREGKKV